MILAWKPFKISLSSLLKWVKENVPSSDGIVASEEHCLIVEKVPFTDEERTLIQNYYDSLDEETEAIKCNFLNVVAAKYMAIKESCIVKTWIDMTILERKIMAGLKLSDAEIQQVYDYDI